MNEYFMNKRNQIRINIQKVFLKLNLHAFYFRKTWKNYPEFTFREQSIHSFFTHAFVLTPVSTQSLSAYNNPPGCRFHGLWKLHVYPAGNSPGKPAGPRRRDCGEKPCGATFIKSCHDSLYGICPHTRKRRSIHTGQNVSFHLNFILSDSHFI